MHEAQVTLDKYSKRVDMMQEWVHRKLAPIVKAVGRHEAQSMEREDILKWMDAQVTKRAETIEAMRAAVEALRIEMAMPRPAATNATRGRWV